MTSVCFLARGGFRLLERPTRTHILRFAKLGSAAVGGGNLGGAWLCYPLWCALLASLEP